MKFEPTIGLEVHAELLTESKMFCPCPVVDSSEAPPNTAVCPVCTGMPGALPVVNRGAVAYALRVALALDATLAPRSLFSRKNYFYPDLPKGYQISQYDQPLARGGQLQIYTSEGPRVIRIRRVHLEEDTGKLTHIQGEGEAYSLVDLNRAGIPLLEIVTEPDLRSPEEVRSFAATLRSVLRYLEVNSGDLEKGVIRIEPNVSVRPSGVQGLGTRVEIKNLNSFRALERSVAYEIQRQSEVLRQGGEVVQETRGWDEARQVTVPQRPKETEDDYRYFPEPDLPPLVVDPEWIAEIRAGLPELPAAKLKRFREQYGLTDYDADVLVAERAVADYYEATQAANTGTPTKVVANWMLGELFGWMNQAGVGIEEIRLKPGEFAELIAMVDRDEINNTTGKAVLAEMLATGISAAEIVSARGLQQVSDVEAIAGWVSQALAAHPEQTAAYLAGKTAIADWLFGQVMRAAAGRANPQVVQKELERQLAALREAGPDGQA